MLWKLAKIVAAVLLWVWAVVAIGIFFSTDLDERYPMDSAFLGRLVVAATSALATLPEALAFGVQLVGIPLQGVREELAGDLGYDPVATTVDGAGSIVASGTAALGGAFEHAIFTGAVLSLSQLAALLLIAAFGVKIGWYRGLPIKPDFVTPESLQGEAQGKVAVSRAVFVFMSVGIGVGIYLVIDAFATGLVAGLLTTLLIILLVRFPFVAGLPLWFLQTIIGIDPTSTFQKLRGASLDLRPVRTQAEGIKQKVQDQMGGKAEASRRDQKTQADEPARPKDTPQAKKSGGSTMPVMGDFEGKYTAACRTFGLDPHRFSEDDVRTRYRERMRQVPHGQPGTESIRQIVNADYEFILRFHGWQR